MSTALQHSPADIVRWLLVSLGLGANPSTASSTNWPVYANKEPSKPDNVLTVYNTTPQSDGKSMIDGEVFLHYGIQIRTRGSDHPSGWKKANAIRVSINEQSYDNHISIDGVSYLVRSLYKTSLLDLGEEVPNSKRTLFTINALVAIRPL